uniref:DNA-3-methyladenine glycosylase I n=1 Tax=Chromera velia CCMP2878 TaxID=1169474 RepID=A0A0G4FUC4_9ALVE|eukprot:Cvel_18725.t1-p1 / transcript=Cvel_18725.t1 / gene=Cvel_18725 / organism=Chromera_velia_CCMP2878 / gene_product=DNA-3-methyladenine glycosylase 1, putative / transcript_product=DNA-3-methyladenine glycosylase 1, putative / location=Cvel_scaffold1570:7149-9195(-) / protein_length=281 / sequence_SO=supercontig / SO=protein_coding / is_pseudo=false
MGFGTRLAMPVSKRYAYTQIMVKKRTETSKAAKAGNESDASKSLKPSQSKQKKTKPIKEPAAPKGKGKAAKTKVTAANPLQAATPAAKAYSYCDYIRDDDTPGAIANKVYHDTAYGFPIRGSDDELFGRLVLEINQAGLSWTTILLKQENFRAAYSNFSVSAVAAYKEADVNRLLNDAGIIRNRMKIDAAIHNANVVREMQRDPTVGSFEVWLNGKGKACGGAKDAWVKAFKAQGFRFVGGEIVNEFLLSSGYLKGAHKVSCPVFAQIEKLKPYWANENIS